MGNFSKNKKKKIKELDAQWKKAVKERDGHLCQYCRLRAGSDAHHIFSRRHLNTRWDIENGITLCKGCHKFIAHGNPELFREFLITKWFKSESKYKNLFARSQLNQKVDLQLWAIALKNYDIICDKEDVWE